MIEWRLFEAKQHKYKLALEWVIILIQKAFYNHNINQEPNTAGGDS